MIRGILYRGPSLINGEPIVVVGVYSLANRKTGPMLQTYILVDGVDPLLASKTGKDEAICGDCQFRGFVTDDPSKKQARDRRCYVVLYHGPLSVYRTLLKGGYPDATSPELQRAMGAGKMVRVGTYGDPAAAPDDMWDNLLRYSTGHTAYTHQSGWRPNIAMQSADSYAEAWGHWRHGRRTFRVLTGVEQIDAAHEILCPASTEAGKRTTCERCKLCDGGKSAKSIAIVEH